MDKDAHRPIRSRDPSREALESMQTLDFFLPPNATNSASYAAKRPRIQDADQQSSSRFPLISSASIARSHEFGQRNDNFPSVNSLLDLDSESSSRTYRYGHQLTSTTVPLPSLPYPATNWPMWGSPYMQSSFPTLNPFSPMYSYPVPYTTSTLSKPNFPLVRSKSTQPMAPTPMIPKSDPALPAKQSDHSTSRSGMLSRYIFINRDVGI